MTAAKVEDDVGVHEVMVMREELPVVSHPEGAQQSQIPSLPFSYQRITSTSPTYTNRKQWSNTR